MDAYNIAEYSKKKYGVVAGKVYYLSVHNFKHVCYLPIYWGYLVYLESSSTLARPGVGRLLGETDHIYWKKLFAGQNKSPSQP